MPRQQYKSRKDISKKYKDWTDKTYDLKHNTLKLGLVVPRHSVAYFINYGVEKFPYFVLRYERLESLENIISILLTVTKDLPKLTVYSKKIKGITMRTVKFSQIRA